VSFSDIEKMSENLKRTFHVTFSNDFTETRYHMESNQPEFTVILTYFDVASRSDHSTLSNQLVVSIISSESCALSVSEMNHNYVNESHGLTGTVALTLSRAASRSAEMIFLRHFAMSGTHSESNDMTESEIVTNSRGADASSRSMADSDSICFSHAMSLSGVPGPGRAARFEGSDATERSWALTSSYGLLSSVVCSLSAPYARSEPFWPCYCLSASLRRMMSGQLPRSELCVQYH
jgi:hypothetical protein